MKSGMHPALSPLEWYASRILARNIIVHGYDSFDARMPESQRGMPTPFHALEHLGTVYDLSIGTKGELVTIILTGPGWEIDMLLKSPTPTKPTLKDIHGQRMQCLLRYDQLPMFEEVRQSISKARKNTLVEDDLVVYAFWSLTYGRLVEKHCYFLGDKDAFDKDIIALKMGDKLTQMVWIV